jgi:hypothetical protein
LIGGLAAAAAFLVARRSRSAFVNLPQRKFSMSIMAATLIGALAILAGSLMGALA